MTDQTAASNDNTEETGFNIYNVKVNGQARRLLSPLPMNVVEEKGLIAEAIAGEVTSDNSDTPHQDFKSNPAFVRFLQWSISQHCSKCDAVEKQALRIQNGNIVVPDFRKPNENGGIEPEEVIGLVEVKDGQIVKFHASPDYQAYTEKGFLKLDAFFQERHMSDLLAYMDKTASQ